ncbi:GNAT family N-acetyltransferase [Chloroflexi bacterium TSY]|nr:GNAT family N-acetyltransferase [Chloroflexi bacterium TSY]
MLVLNDLLLNTIENSFLMFPHLPGISEHLNFPGVQGRTSPLSHPLLNIIGAARLDPDQTDATIHQIRTYFAEQEKSFGWLLTPSTTPTDLGQRLESAGLQKAFEMAGMVLTDLSIPIRTNPDVEIREATDEEMLAARDMVGDAYGLPANVAELSDKIMVGSADTLKVRRYLAYIDGMSEPVGFGYLLYVPEQPVVVLQGSATLEAYRGRGIYSTFVAQRLADARADGIEAAVIQAVRDTSAPICAKLGFQEICNLDFYTWTPNGDTHE